jgi:hypothetical protein
MTGHEKRDEEIKKVNEKLLFSYEEMQKEIDKESRECFISGAIFGILLTATAISIYYLIFVNK